MKAIAALVLASFAFTASAARPSSGVDALRQLAMKYYQGDGVPQDAQRAVSLLAMAVRGGDAESAIRLGKMYEFGMGVEADESRAADWYLRGAELGDSSAQFEIAILYYKGRGRDRDVVEAAKWWTLAMMKADGRAESMRLGVESAEAKLTPAQLEEGKRRAAAWHEAHSKRTSR